MIIDCNVHHLPQNLFTDEKMLDGFFSTAPRPYGWVPSLEKLPTGKTQLKLEMPKGYPVLNYVEGDYSLESKLKAMDDAGVDKAIIRVPVWQEWLRLDTCKIINDEAAAMCKASNGRLFANACLPPWGGKDNLYELERCVKGLGMVGVQMACHYGQLYLDDEVFKPFLKVLNDMDIPTVVHHTPLPVRYESLYHYTNLRREFGRVVDQGHAVGRELFSHMFEEFPNLKFIHTMFGGNWFAMANLCTPHATGKNEAMDRLNMGEGEKIQKYLKNNIYFDMSHPHSWGKAQVECAVKVCGADHLLFGSSYPVFYGWMKQSLEFVKGLDVSEADRELMLSGNARRLFKLDTAKKAGA